MATPDQLHKDVSLYIETDSSDIEESRFNHAKGWLREHQLKLALGLAAVSTTVTLTSESFDTTKDQVIEAAPWVAGGLVAAEVGWIGGAAIMMASVGDKVGNPLKIRSKMPEIAKKAKDSLMFKSGFALNYASAVGQAAIVGGAVIKELPPQAWGMAGIAALDLSATVALRQAIWGSIKEKSLETRTETITPEDQTSMEVVYHEIGTVDNQENVISSRPTVRKASTVDVERLAEIDLARYKRVYGKELPEKKDLEDMFRQRLINATSDWMYVCEIDGKVEGFVTGFKTEKPIEEFSSWEDSTANGTLDGCVDPDGRYGYVANLTVNPKATKLGGDSMIMGYLMAQAIEDGLEYGYFVSRIPLFSAWIKRQVREGRITESELSPGVLEKLAEQYVNYKKEVNGKEVRVDYELRMYEESGFEISRIVPNAFEDPQSLNFGVLFKANVPPKSKNLKKITPVRKSLATGLRKLSNNPRLLEKLL